MANKSLKLNAVLNITRSIMNLLFPLITFPYSSRILMPEGIGRVRFAQSIVSYFMLFAELGISQYALRECVKRKSNRPELDKFCQEIFFIYCISTFISYVLLFLTVSFVPKLQEIALLIFISSLTIVFNTLSLDWLFTAFEEFTYTTLRSIILQCISLAVLFIFVKSREDYLIYASLLVISAGGQGLSNFFFRKKYISLKPTQKLNLKQHIKPILSFFLIAAIFQIYTVFDTSMLGFLSTEEQIGFYSAATKLNKMVVSLLIACTAVMVPRMNQFANKEDKSEFHALLFKGISFVFFMGIASAIGLNILSKPIIHLFSGELYYPAVPVMKVMNPIIIIMGVASILSTSFFVATGREKIVIRAVSFGAITNFTLNCLLIPHYGAFGAAIATLCAESAVTLTQVIAAILTVSFKPLIKDLLQYAVAGSVMTLILLIEINHIDSQMVQLAVGIVSGAIIYIGLLFMMKNRIVGIFFNTIMKKIRRG